MPGIYRACLFDVNFLRRSYFQRVYNEAIKYRGSRIYKPLQNISSCENKDFEFPYTFQEKSVFNRIVIKFLLTLFCCPPPFILQTLWIRPCYANFTCESMREIKIIRGREGFARFNLKNVRLYTIVLISKKTKHVFSSTWSFHAAKLLGCAGIDFED